MALPEGEGVTRDAVGLRKDDDARVDPADRRLVPGSWVRRAGGAILGLAIGGVLGFYVTLTIFVAEARAGRYVFSLDDLVRIRWQFVPTVLGLAGGTILGWRRVRDLLSAAGTMLAGALLPTPLGWFAGSAIWTGSSGPWAGALIASGAGVLLGAAVAAWRRRRRGAAGRGPPS